MSKLTAESRADFGKGAARRLRREGKIPAVVYGHGTSPVHVAIDAHELTLTLRKKPASIEVSVDGKTQTVAPRDLQIDPVTRNIEHVDLVIVTAAEAAKLARDAAEQSAKAEADAIHAAEVAAAKAAQRAERQESETANAAEGGSADESASGDSASDDSSAGE
jgi:ribosomal protein L25 (general stress protein Ctc)